MTRFCPRASKLKLFYSDFKAAVLGGTFDRLHIAHKGLISLTLDVSKEAHIGIMDDEWVKKKGKNSSIQSYEVRSRNLMRYLETIGEANRTVITSLSDPYSYALKGEQAKKLDSIVISSEKGVLTRTIELNSMRERRGLKPLKIVKMPLVKDFQGKTISSTRLRRGDLKLRVMDIEFVFDEKTLSSLKTPKGEFYKTINDVPYFSDCIITVGDVVTESFVRENIPISVAIIDRVSRREHIKQFPIFTKETTERGEINVPIYLPAINNKSTLSHQAWFTVTLALAQSESVVIRIYGEEDLLGFPATIMAPNGAQVIYGDPFKKGIVVIYVDDETKERAISFIKKASLRRMNLFLKRTNL